MSLSIVSVPEDVRRFEDCGCLVKSPERRKPKKGPSDPETLLAVASPFFKQAYHRNAPRQYHHLINLASHNSNPVNIKID
jgi:hypothetical protein